MVTKTKRNTGGRKVVKKRKGTDTVYSFGAGGRVKKRYDTVHITAKNGDKWEIPVDKNGKVPREALYAIFLSSDERYGGKRMPLIDILTDADVIYEEPKGGFTPEQLVQTGWIQHPNRSDILGVDTKDSEAFSKEIPGTAKSATKVGKKMPLFMPEKEQVRAREILGKNFTGSELKKAVKDNGLIIREGNPGRGASGCYYPIQETASLSTPEIILRPGWDEDTLTHEFIHHLRATDKTRGGLTKSPMKFAADGRELTRPSHYDSRSDYNARLNLEEAATVAESTARTRKYNEHPTGYYAVKGLPHGENAYARYKHDRNLLVGPIDSEKPSRGRNAERRVKKEFSNISISHLNYFHPGSSAISYAKSNLKIDEKPTKAKAKSTAAKSSKSKSTVKKTTARKK